MFFEPQYWEKGAPVALSAEVVLEGEGYVRTLLTRLPRQGGTVQQVRVAEKLPDALHIQVTDETYALEIGETEIVLYGSTLRAQIYAAVTLLQMETLVTGRLEDTPDCAFRGYRVYLPGRKSFADFYAMVDTLAYYKYNYLSLEIGGAMEYKRHPEINEVWQGFAAETHRYSGRTKEIQNGFGWFKNSIHTDNGEGDILTQEEVRQLIGYCRERGLEVYPEVPTLSHSDYICMAHPELAERPEDPYADTYCPNHPDTYKIVFDILEEVIGVFQPKLINIGHDEFYTVGCCPRCRGQKPEALYAADITRIHDFLAERGIRTAMWGEKLLPVVTETGRTYGGAGMERESGHGLRVTPPTFLCQSLLPKDILMIHWYYSFGLQYDFVFHTHGYETIFGNTAAERVADWRFRRNRGIKGASCSNWGSNHPEYMQRNCQYLHLIFGAYALWNPHYDSDQQPTLLKKTFEEAFRLHFGGQKVITISHTTDLQIPYKVFYDGIFIEDEIYHMGHYQVTYTDGTTALLEVKYGTNISSSAIPYRLDDNKEGFNPTSLDESALGEVCYSAVPFVKGGKTWYKTAYPDPHPEKTVAEIVYLPDRPETVEFEY